jgi:hypothetical protein
MRIDVAITNDNQESEICRFISVINKFNIFFKQIDEIDDKTNELTIIIASKKDDAKQIKNLKTLLVHECANFIFLIPSSLKSISNTINNKIIYFPINIIDFEKEVSKHANNMSIKFGSFSLTSQNLLFENNNQHIYLTEPEAHIIKLLFLNKSVKKDQIKTEVLKLSPAVESKSLETHLYRLRKKLSILSPSISIRSVDKNSLVIAETN